MGCTDLRDQMWRHCPPRPSPLLTPSGQQRLRFPNRRENGAETCRGTWRQITQAERAHLSSIVVQPEHQGLSLDQADNHGLDCAATLDLDVQPLARAPAQPQILGDDTLD